MTRIRHTETKTIDDLVFTINFIECMEYNGEWHDGGFDVIFNGHTKNFIGYPIKKDLLEFSKQILTQ